jgi:hypothetical protein
LITRWPKSIINFNDDLNFSAITRQDLAERDQKAKNPEAFKELVPVSAPLRAEAIFA